MLDKDKIIKELQDLYNQPDTREGLLLLGLLVDIRAGKFDVEQPIHYIEPIPDTGEYWTNRYNDC